MRPPAAALFAAERARDLEGFVAALVSGHQLFADLLDAEEDRANGNTTHVLFRLYERTCGDRQARAALYGSGGFDAVVSGAWTVRVGDGVGVRVAAGPLAVAVTVAPSCRRWDVACQQARGVGLRA